MRVRPRALTVDRDSAILVRDQIGESRALTPEGFLLCTNVPFARAGWMTYGPGETPVKTKDGYARVFRDTAALFAEDTIASFNGKPIVDDHPEEDVTPDNWAKLSKGTMLNVRPGEGVNDDCLVCDALIMDKQLIKDVLAGKREVSAGYEAHYKDEGDGKGTQSHIIGNHLALVDRGRCGPRCSIGDRELDERATTMADKRVRVRPRRAPVPDAVRQIFRDAESAALEAMGVTGDPGGDDGGDGMGGDEDDNHIHIHLHGAGEGGGQAASGTDEVDPNADPNAVDPNAQPGGEGDLASRVTALEAGLNKIITLLEGQQNPNPAAGGGNPDPNAPPPGEGDPTKDEQVDEDDEDGQMAKTGDSAAMETGYTDLCAKAEILVPGFRVPTFDAKATRAATRDRMCAARRRVLDIVASTTDGATLLSSVNGGTEPDLAKLDCKQAAILFKAAAGTKALLNNARTADGKPGTALDEGKPEKKGIQSPADLNAYNQQRWSANAGK